VRACTGAHMHWTRCGLTDNNWRRKNGERIVNLRKNICCKAPGGGKLPLPTLVIQKVLRMSLQQLDFIINTFHDYLQWWQSADVWSSWATLQTAVKDVTHCLAIMILLSYTDLPIFPLIKTENAYSFQFWTNRDLSFLY